MTTVSKPNRNPASAEVMDQKNMRYFMIVDARVYYFRLIVVFALKLTSILLD
jgi:hypothetical protein